MDAAARRVSSRMKRGAVVKAAGGEIHTLHEALAFYYYGRISEGFPRFACSVCSGLHRSEVSLLAFCCLVGAAGRFTGNAAAFHANLSLGNMQMESRASTSTVS